jgi:hypothetical protein
VLGSETVQLITGKPKPAVRLSLFSSRLADMAFGNSAVSAGDFPQNCGMFRTFCGTIQKIVFLSTRIHDKSHVRVVSHS